MFHGRWKTSAGSVSRASFLRPQTSADLVFTPCPLDSTARWKTSAGVPYPQRVFSIPQTSATSSSLPPSRFTARWNFCRVRVPHARPLVDRQNIQARGPAQWLACARGRKLAHTAPVGGPWGDLAPPVGYSIFKERCSVLRRSTSGRTLIRFAHGTYQYAFWLCSLDFEVLRWDYCTSC